MTNKKTASQRSINAALKLEGIPLEFVSTRNGYQYFIYDGSGDVQCYETFSEMVAYVSQLSIDQWIDRARSVMRDIASR